MKKKEKTRRVQVKKLYTFTQARQVNADSVSTETVITTISRASSCCPG